MRWDRLRLRGIGPFLGEVDLDLASMPGPLVAVTGPNGAGKTMLLESMAAGLLRRMRSRGPLSGVATGSDAFVSVTVDAGRGPITVTQLVDAVSEAGSTSIVGADGTALTAGGGVREGDAWIKENMPAPQVIFSSLFQAQEDLGFVALTPADRTDVVLRVLDLDWMGAASKWAGKRRAEAETAVAAAKSAVDALAPADVDDLKAKLADADARRDAAGADRDAARRALDDAMAIEQDAAAMAAVARAQAEQRRVLSERVADSRREIESVQERLRNNRTLLASAAEVRAAQATIDAKRREVAVLNAELANAAATTRARRAEYEAHKAECAKLERVAEDRARTIAAARASLGDGPTVVEATESVTSWRVTRDAIQARLDAAIDLSMNGSASRITGLRGALLEIFDDASNPTEIAGQAIADDDVLVGRIEDVPATIEALRREAADTAKILAGEERALAAAGERERKRSEIAANERTLEEVRARLAAARELALSATKAEEQALATEAAVTKAIRQAERDIRDAEPKAIHAAKLDGAEARIEEYVAILAERTEAIARHEAELAAMPTLVVADSGDAVAVARSRLATHEAAHEAATSERAVLVAEIERAENDAREVARRREQLREATEELTDWALLEQAFGREGMQALEIDGAAPELTANIRELVTACYGDRFTVTIEATRDRARGGGAVDGFFIWVEDATNGKRLDVRQFSGGERAVLREGIALALTKMVVERAGMSEVTLVRDEPTAALDPDHVTSYVRMLRAGARAIGARHVFFVSHNQDAQALADTRLVVGGGMARVE